MVALVLPAPALFLRSARSAWLQSIIRIGPQPIDDFIADMRCTPGTFWRRNNGVGRRSFRSYDHSRPEKDENGNPRVVSGARSPCL